ncbi:unnamed protein product, partial [Musa hybrid cultivar]
ERERETGRGEICSLFYKIPPPQRCVKRDTTTATTTTTALERERGCFQHSLEKPLFKYGETPVTHRRRQQRTRDTEPLRPDGTPTRNEYDSPQFLQHFGTSSFQFLS